MSYAIQLAAFVGLSFVAAPYLKDTPFNASPCYIAIGIVAAWICAQIGARSSRIG